MLPSKLLHCAFQALSVAAICGRSTPQFFSRAFTPAGVAILPATLRQRNFLSFATSIGEAEIRSIAAASTGSKAPADKRARRSYRTDASAEPLRERMNAQQLNDLLRPMMLPDLRIECRARGLNPAGGREALADRVRQHMLSTENYVLAGQEAPVKDSEDVNAPATGNNYSRPEGQNVGNFLTDRNSSRVIQPPGGKSQISFGGAEEAPSPVKTKVAFDSFPEDESFTDDTYKLGSPIADSPKYTAPVPDTPQSGEVEASPKIAASRGANNNYHRSEGQNVGNFMTDRNSSRVIAPPGGRSNISFG